MKIAFCVPEMEWLKQLIERKPSDPTSIVLSYVSSGLADRGHQLSYFAPSGSEDIVSSPNLQPLSVVPRTWTNTPFYYLAGKVTWRTQMFLGIPYLNFFSNFSCYDAYLSCLKGHDIVYERINLWSSAVAMACSRLKLPYVLFFEADQIFELDYTGKELNRLLRRRAAEIQRYNLNTAKAIICVSEQAKTDLIAHWNVKADKVAVFNNGVDLKRFCPRPAEKSRVRAELGIADNSPVFIFVGSFYQWHDISTLLEAFCRVRDISADARLVLVGDGENRKAMEEKAEALGILQAVRFTGYVPHDDVPRLISAADVAVVPYPRMQQGLWMSPLKLYEFMASEIAIVASNLGQISQVITHGVNGLLVPPGDAQEMAAAMVRLATDADLRNKLSKKAREDAVVKHSWQLYAQHMEDLFSSVVSGQLSRLESCQ